jgi:hypothetical protein
MEMFGQHRLCLLLIFPAIISTAIIPDAVIGKNHFFKKNDSKVASWNCFRSG